MKQFLLSLILSTTLFSITAQITLSRSGFPQAGDTLITAVDNLPTNIAITGAGGNQTWNFANLQAPFSRRTIYGKAAHGSAGTDFPNANLVANIATGADGYFKIDKESVELVGLFGADPLELGLEIITKYQPALELRRAPMKYEDEHQSEGTLLLPFSTDELPTGVFDQLPITPDSLRIKISSTRNDIVDAWGSVIIPEEKFEVLREKRTEYRDTKLEAKVGKLNWQDITQLAIATLSKEGADLLGKDTIVTHNFFAEDIKETVAIITLNANETVVEKVEFKASNLSSNTNSADAVKPGVYAFPNPAIEDVRFEFSNLEAGNYDLKLFNIVGAEVWSDKYFINGNRAIKVDISNLKKGTYLYNLVNDRNKTITTRRLVVIRP